MRTPRRWLPLVCVLVLGIASPAGAKEPLFSAPGNYILALGDSITFGFQRVRFLANPDPATFNTGWVDVFEARLQATAPGRDIQVINYGCPGETTASFLTGPCAYHALLGLPLHDNFTGSQMDAAEAFLAAHPGQVGPILISLGANDVLAAVDACGPGLDFQCLAALIPETLFELAVNYDQILARLRAAAPNAEIIVLQLYNPLAIIELQLIGTDQNSNFLTLELDATIAAVATPNRARLVNPFPAFNLTPPEPATLCAETLMCTPLVDIHPSDAGYMVIGNLAFIASGYTRFEH